MVRRRLPRLLVVTLLAAVTAWALGSAAFAWWYTGRGHQHVRPLPGDFGYPVSEVSFNATDGVPLSGWLVRCEGSVRGAILLHGKDTTRSQMIARAHLLRGLGYTVLLYDARAHGRSGGKVSSFGWHEANDLVGALEFLQRNGVRETGCLGASQGAATIAYAAPRLPGLKWAVLEGGYCDLATTLDHRFRRLTGLPRAVAGAAISPVAAWRIGTALDELAPTRFIGQLRCPVFVLCGDADPYNPPADTAALFAAAREPKRLWLVPGAAHRDLYGFAGPDYERRLVDFLRQSAP